MAKQKQIWSIPLVLTLILSGCGEAFRGQSNPSATDLNSGEGLAFTNGPGFSSDGFRQPINLSADDRVLQMYRMELQGREMLTSQWSSQVRALDLSLTHEATGNSVRVESQVHLSCEQSFRFQGQVSRASLLAGSPVQIASDQTGVSLRFQCLDSFCQEVVVALTRVAGSNSATVLVGMAANLHQGQSVSYMSRSASRVPYFAAYPSGPQFRQVSQCSSSRPQTVTDRIVDRIQEEASEFLIREANDFLRRIF